MNIRFAMVVIICPFCSAPSLNDFLESLYFISLNLICAAHIFQSLVITPTAGYDNWRSPNCYCVMRHGTELTSPHHHLLLLLPSPPCIPNTVNYRDGAVIDHVAGRRHKGPRLNNDKCSPQLFSLDFVGQSVCCTR